MQFGVKDYGDLRGCSEKAKGTQIKDELNSDLFWFSSIKITFENFAKLIFVDDVPVNLCSAVLSEASEGIVQHSVKCAHLLSSLHTQ